jgi:hypothetical protein
VRDDGCFDIYVSPNDAIAHAMASLFTRHLAVFFTNPSALNDVIPR